MLNIPEHYRVVAVIGLGYPAADPPAKQMVPMDEVIHHELFRGGRMTGLITRIIAADHKSPDR